MDRVYSQIPLVCRSGNSTPAQVKLGICEWILVGWKLHRIEEQLCTTSLRQTVMSAAPGNSETGTRTGTRTGMLSEFHVSSSFRSADQLSLWSWSRGSYLQLLGSYLPSSSWKISGPSDGFVLDFLLHSRICYHDQKGEEVDLAQNGGQLLCPGRGVIKEDGSKFLDLMIWRGE